MADIEAAPAAPEVPAGRGFGRGRGGDRGRGRGRGRGGRDAGEKDVWVPCTKLGRLVKDQKITTLEEIFVFSMPIKEHQIVDALIPESVLRDEMMSVFPVQKATSAGQRTRFKAFNVVGDCNGHIGIGARVGKEVSLAIRASMIAAKLNIVPVRRGYWGNKIGEPHTIPMKVTGKCGSISVRLVPAPRGTGIVAAPVPKKILEFAGVEDVYTSSCGKTRTRGNFIMATFYALRKTYGFLTPDLWAETEPERDPCDKHSAHLATKTL
ncbi:small subunit ribosomal protein S2e [Angomonas deanei]|uniref:Small ribosomal subunit protein uS5 n=2 Tax=Angomonas deanei TaxID=59799 RepID=A0A7G2CET4_9TRYP|nr:small subunit ribosomal protein S2e [Angomonas deanei]CAD2217527.1 Ribosomal protein S5, N-terminal domain/Ribosomal protein S5, C-terminal domain containing protein, putative [Angomonas deanei]|eukprot:EPY42585.1 small subunit ribosomal protein S2e [Angomonas deanei]